MSECNALDTVAGERTRLEHRAFTLQSLEGRFTERAILRMGDPKPDNLNVILDVIPLSAVDHLFVGEGMPGIDLLFHFASPPDPRRLAEALSEVLDVFAPVRGTLVRLDRASYGIELGPWELETHWRVEQVDKLPEADDFAALAKCLDPVKSIEGEPLFRAKLTVAPDGAWLATSISHAVADGYSVFLFLDAWARAARGEYFPTPLLDRAPLIPPVSPLAEKVTAENFHRRTGYLWEKSRPHSGSQKFSTTVRGWSAAETAEFFDRHAEGAGLSLNDCLVASLWKELGEKWAPPGSSSFRLRCAYDYRRFYPGLGPLFFGNAVAATHASLSAEKFREASVRELAEAAREATKRADLPWVRDFLSCLEETRQQNGAAVIDQINLGPTSNTFFVTNFSRFPLRQLDFGSGAPQRMRSLVPIPRMVVVLPVAGGGLELQIQSPEEA